MRAIVAWRRYWFAPAPLVDLGVSRIVLAVILVILLGRTRYLPLAWTSAELFTPVGPLRWLGLGKPDAATLSWMANASLALLAAIALGVWTRIALVLFLALFLYQEACINSLGKITHGTLPLLYAVAFFALAPCDRAATLPRLWRRRRGEVVEPAGTSEYARWPLQLLFIELASFYGSAGVTKLRRAGLAWADGYTLQFHLLTKDTAAGVWVAQHLWLCAALSALVLVLELAFPLGIVFRRLRPLLLCGGALFHLGTTVLMNVTFWPVVATYLLFVPWHRLVPRRSAGVSP